MEKKLKFEYKRKKRVVGKLPVGTRFLYKSHGTSMIASDMFINSCGIKTRICVSESGLAEQIPVTEEVDALDKSVQRAMISVNSRMINAVL